MDDTTREWFVVPLWIICFALLPNPFAHIRFKLIHETPYLNDTANTPIVALTIVLDNIPITREIVVLGRAEGIPRGHLRGPAVFQRAAFFPPDVDLVGGPPSVRPIVIYTLECGLIVLSDGRDFEANGSSKGLYIIQLEDGALV